jgi:hypothetical protein
VAAAPSKPLFEEDEVTSSGLGFMRRLWSLAHNQVYHYKQDGLSSRIHQLEPQVRALMERKDIENFTKDERDVVADWITLNQNYHTYRRRKFMMDSAERLEEMSAPKRSPWDVTRDELMAEAQKRDAELYPGGSRANLWSQEAKYMAAETYSRENLRFAMMERSMDATKVPGAPQRNFHLEPSIPPSYQARAAMALKNEDRSLDKASNDRLQALIAKRHMENPLDTTVALNLPIVPPHVQSLLNWMGVPLPNPSQRPSSNHSNSPLSNNDQQGQDPHDPTPNTIIDRLRSWFAKNGPLGVTLYLSYSTIDLTLIYLLISAGIDVSSLLAAVGISTGAGAATFAVAYAIHKMLAPLRAGLVVLTLPYAKPHWDRLISALETKLVLRDAAKHAKMGGKDDTKQ